ncbi:helix-turn-helix domain-containing protein [Nocardia vaccinii]|uniref:helix-turn-helix domain-containing protein n=1 Tax=Nocardia vaccinii TaxID=1822 RepID=UPI0008352016|nr:helix-turn-helix transcriptional regulator [Nocardia vaccinii]
MSTFDDASEDGTAEEGRYIGKQVRRYRRVRGLTQQVLADRAGVQRTMISRAETGERPIDSRDVLYRLAGALSVSVGDLTGHAEDKVNPATAAFGAAVPAIEGALMAAGITDGSRDPRPLPELVTDAERAPVIRMQCDYATLGAMLPGLITGLYQHATGGGDDAERAWRALVPATLTVGLTTRSLGYTSLAWIAATACERAANLVGDPAGRAAAEYVLAQTLLAQPGAAAASLAHSAGAADALQSTLAGTGTGLQMYGMLHLHAALTSAVMGTDPGDHLSEAAETARRTGTEHGDADAFALSFGTQNTNIWRMSIALEQRDGGKAIEASRLITPDTIPTEDRRGRFYVELGRAYALEKQYPESLSALLFAERIAPQEVRAMPTVRELVGAMLRKARRDLTAGELGRLASRVGAA